MSYILDAIKKAEPKRQPVQTIDYEDKPVKIPQKQPFWLWLTVLVIMNVLSFTALLYPNKPLEPPRVHIVPTMPHSSVINVAPSSNSYRVSEK